MSSQQRQRSVRTHAVVLRRRDYADADRVLTVYTPALGKQEFIAKGVRKTSSRKAGHLELFMHSTLQIAQARTWDIITEAMIVESYRHLRVDLDCIGYASYVCELIDCFSKDGDENVLLWDLLLLALRELDEIAAEGNLEQGPLLLRWFELQLLSATGFQPQLFHCISCGNVIDEQRNFLQLAEGGVLCPECAPRISEVEPIEADVLKILRFLQSRDWNSVRPVTVRVPVLDKVQNVLYRYLLLILERQLKSTDFLQRLRRARPANLS